jgi:MFS family permease
LRNLNTVSHGSWQNQRKIGMSTLVAVSEDALGAATASVNARRLFVAGCLALATSAFTFVVRSDILQDMGDNFRLSQASKGWIEGALFIGMAVSLLGGGLAVEAIGFGYLVALSWACYLLSVIGMMAAPTGEIGVLWLMAASFLMGCGNGLVDASATPLVATLYAHRKTESLNLLHAGFPAGLVVGGLAAWGLHSYLGLHWRLTLGLILLPCFCYGYLILGQSFPASARDELAGSRGAVYLQALRPAFLLVLIAAILAVMTDLAPQKWLASVMTCTVGISGTLVLVYTGCVTFVMRRFAGPAADTLSPVGFLAVCAVLACAGLYLMSTASSVLEVFAFATLYGIGIGRLWPTLLGVTADGFPAGGAFLLALLGLTGILSTSQVMPVLGHVFDHYTVQHLSEEAPALAARVTVQGALDSEAVLMLAETERAVVRRAQSVGAAMIFRWACVLPALLLVVLIIRLACTRLLDKGPRLRPNMESSTA